MPLSPDKARYRSDLAKGGILSVRQATAAVPQTAPPTHKARPTGPGLTCGSTVMAPPGQRQATGPPNDHQPRLADQATCEPASTGSADVR